MFYKYTSGFVWLDHWYCNCGIDVEVALWSFHGFQISSPFEAAVGCLSSIKITILFSELNVVFFGISYFSFSVTGIFHCWWQMPSRWILRTHWWCQGCGQGCGSLLEGWRKYSQVRIESGWLVVEENVGGLRTLAKLLQLGSEGQEWVFFWLQQWPDMSPWHGQWSLWGRSTADKQDGWCQAGNI